MTLLELFVQITNHTLQSDKNLLLTNTLHSVTLTAQQLKTALSMGTYKNETNDRDIFL